MNSIEKANTACALANITTRAAIRALKAAIVEMKEMRDCGDVPADCMAALVSHLNELKDQKSDLRQMLHARKATCAILTDCLADGGVIITPQDGGK